MQISLTVKKHQEKEIARKRSRIFNLFSILWGKKLQEKHPKTKDYEIDLTRTGQSDAHQVSKRTAGRSVPPPPPQDQRVSLPLVTDSVAVVVGR